MHVASDIENDIASVIIDNVASDIENDIASYCDH